MTASVQIAHNAVVAKLVGATASVINDAAALLTYEVEGREHMGAFQTSGWDGRSSFYNRTNDTFPAGFVHAVQHALTSKGIQVGLVRNPLPEPMGPENPIVDEFGNDDPRYDFQLKALRQVEKHGRGIVQIATGGGKSKVAKLIAARYRRPTLFLTTRSVLMNQMAADFVAAKLPVGIVGDGEWTPRRGINVGMVQTFVSKLKEPHVSGELRDLIDAATAKGETVDKKALKELAERRVAAKLKNRETTIKFLEMIEVVIGEEAHEAGGNSYYEILKHCRNANIRVALTATPFMKEDAEDNMRLMAAFGPVLIKVSEKLLIERGILAKPIFRYAPYEPHPKLRRTSPWQRAYQLGIVESQGRNKLIIANAIMAKLHGLTTMVLVSRRDHGAKLRAAMEKVKLRVAFIQGENDNKERQAALAQLRAGKIDVLIGTNILDVGVDVPSVGLIVLAAAGKEQVALRQRIGRGLRAKKKGPNVALILDFEDTGNDHLRKHYRQRRAIVEATPGFVENILPDGSDFPWGIFTATT